MSIRCNIITKTYQILVIALGLGVILYPRPLEATSSSFVSTALDKTSCIDPLALMSLDSIDFSILSREDLLNWKAPSALVEKLAHAGLLSHNGIRGETGTQAKKKLAHSLKDLSQHDLFTLLSPTWIGIRTTLAQRFDKDNIHHISFAHLPEPMREALFDIALHFYPDLNKAACPVGRFWKEILSAHYENARKNIIAVLLQSERGKRDLLWLDKSIMILDPSFHKLIEKNYHDYGQMLDAIH